MLLSIAIPTFNRSKDLRVSLGIIIPQIKKYGSDVEIVVSDNASTDNTEEMIHDIEKEYGFFIAYKKLDKGIYFEDNFKAVVSRTKGDYIHLMGDDDILSPSFYDSLITIIKNKDVSLVHFNWITGDYNCANGVLFDKSFESNYIIEKTPSFIKRVMNAPGFMTSLVFKRECWNVGEEYEKENYYGYHFLGRVYQGAMRMNYSSVYFNFPMIIMRSPIRTWSKTFPLFFFVGYSNIFNDLDIVLPGVKSQWLEKIHKTDRCHYLTILSGVNKDKSKYKKLKAEFWPFLNKFQKLTYNFMISPLSCKVTRGIYYTFIHIVY